MSDWIMNELNFICEDIVLNIIVFVTQIIATFSSSIMINEIAWRNDNNWLVTFYFEFHFKTIQFLIKKKYWTLVINSWLSLVLFRSLVIFMSWMFYFNFILNLLMYLCFGGSPFFVSPVMESGAFSRWVYLHSLVDCLYHYHMKHFSFCITCFFFDN